VHLKPWKLEHICGHELQMPSAVFLAWVQLPLTYHILRVHNLTQLPRLWTKSLQMV